MTVDSQSTTTMSRREPSRFLAPQVAERVRRVRGTPRATPVAAVPSARPTRHGSAPMLQSRAPDAGPRAGLWLKFRLGLPVAVLVALTLIAPRLMAAKEITGAGMGVLVMLMVGLSVLTGAGLLAIGRWFGLHPREVQRLVDDATVTAARIALRQMRRR